MTKRFTNEQIAFALRQAESGIPVREVRRKMGVTDVTFYRWKKNFVGMGVTELRRVRQLEEENRMLKQLVADLSLDKEMQQDVIQKNSEACSIYYSQGALLAARTGLRRSQTSPTC